MDIFTYIMLVKKKILIFTATYNEKDNIESLIRSINFHNPEVDILIIDDNSPDLTFEKVKESETSSDKEAETLDVQSLEDAPEDAGDELSVISKSFPGAQIISEET